MAVERSRAPHHTRIPPASAELRAEVLAYHADPPGEGYRSIANEIGKAHDRQKVISYTKVGEILLANGPRSRRPTWLQPHRR